MGKLDYFRNSISLFQKSTIRHLVYMYNANITCMRRSLLDGYRIDTRVLVRYFSPDSSENIKIS